MASYSGYRPADHATPYAKYYAENIAPMLPHVVSALAQSPLPAGSLPALEEAPALLQEGYRTMETGFTLEPDGSARVAVLTPMPRVSPLMWHWWFGWHGSEANRYKLWHPKAHRNARWKDGQGDLAAYVGRTSLIEEYIGKKLENASIRFIPPAELGLPATNDLAKAVFICARVGYTRLPLDFGWLVHQVRATAGGAEMRSRFWMGGRHVHLRSKSPLSAILSKGIRLAGRIPENQARDLLTHCAEEMNHLAAFLPDLYAQFHP
jgi:hypothetical protein